MTFVNKVKFILSARSYVINWVSIFTSVLMKKPSDIRLWNGSVIKSVKDPYDVIRLIESGYSVEVVNEKIVRVSKENLKILCRTQTGFDFGHIVEIFENNTYLVDFRNKVVIDVGASNGDSSIFFWKNGASKVIGIEPMSESYELASENIKINRAENSITILNAALSHYSGFIDLQVSSDNPNANSISPTKAVRSLGIQFDEVRKIKSMTLAEIIDTYKVEEVGLLKMDCEGCEYDVLKNLSDEVFDKISSIRLEYHEGLQFLPEYLTSKGYVCNYQKSEGLGILDASKIVEKGKSSIA